MIPQSVCPAKLRGRTAPAAREVPEARAAAREVPEARAVPRALPAARAAEDRSKEAQDR